MRTCRHAVVASLLAAAAPLALAQAAPAAGDAPAPEPLPAVKSNAALKGKRFYLAEYRVLFEVSGNVSASTRAAYFGGRDYGATRVSVNYKVPQPNLQLLQAITDKAHADFLARLEAAGLQPEPAEAFVQANGAIYEFGAPGSRPGAEVYEDVELGWGKRRYLVMAPTGTRTVARGFIGLGAGNIGKRIEWSKAQLEGVSVSMVVNLAAQESSGGGSSMFKRGSSANASAAMEVAMAPRMGGVLQTHAHSQVVSLGGPWPAAGLFATLRETGGYDSSKDAVVSGINMLGRLTMGVAGNNSKRVDMALEVDEAALADLAGKALSAVNAAVAGAIQ